MAVNLQNQNFPTDARLEEICNESKTEWLNFQSLRYLFLKAETDLPQSLESRRGINEHNLDRPGLFIFRESTTIDDFQGWDGELDQVHVEEGNDEIMYTTMEYFFYIDLHVKRTLERRIYQFTLEEAFWLIHYRFFDEEEPEPEPARAPPPRLNLRGSRVRHYAYPPSP